MVEGEGGARPQDNSGGSEGRFRLEKGNVVEREQDPGP